MSKINLFITLLLLTSVGCGATYWICRDDYATDNPLARGIIANPITSYILLSWYSGYPAVICSIISLIVLVCYFIQSVDDENEKKVRVECFGLCIATLLVLVFHVVTFFTIVFNIG